MAYMFRIMTADQAVAHIQDGAWLGLNAFLALAAPAALHEAIARSYEKTGHPKGLKIYSPCGFGCWDEQKLADRYTLMGAVDTVVTSHFPSIPGIERMAREGKIQAYSMPLGVMSHCVRAAAAGQKGCLSKVGLNLSVDPRLEGAAVNAISHEEWVKLVTIEGEEYLFYRTPRIDVALIKGTSVDPVGNIAFSDECVTGDALALAQATKANGGMVVVQVDRVSHTFERPRNVIVPGILVDIVVVSDQRSIESEVHALSGDIHVPSTQMEYWMRRIESVGKGKTAAASAAHNIIGRRAARELRAGQTVNIGVGTPELVSRYAADSGILRDIVLSVESGGVGGLPAPGNFFGATIGADCIVDMAQQFDYYDGGGLDICFMGALEVDMRGNVNVHRLPNRYVGMGGFANITSSAKTVVFCLPFTAKGLAVSESEGRIHIEKEGGITKFRRSISAVSFSALNALKKGQRVMYITERCVFELVEDGLRLIEVYPGIDRERDIVRRLEFELAR